MKLGRYLVCVFIVLGVLIITLLMAGGKIINFLDYVSLVLVVIPTFALLVSSVGFRVVKDSFLLAFSKKDADPSEYKQASIVVGSCRQYLYIVALLVTVLSLINMLAHWDGNTQAFVLHTSVLLLTPLYSILIHFLFIEPIRVYLKRKAVV